jgi:hypothetical protein
VQHVCKWKLSYYILLLEPRSQSEKCRTDDAASQTAHSGGSAKDKNA